MIHRDRAESERGAGMVEYALLVALIAISLLFAVGFLSGSLNASFESSGSSIENAL